MAPNESAARAAAPSDLPLRSGGSGRAQRGRRGFGPRNLARHTFASQPVLLTARLLLRQPPSPACGRYSPRSLRSRGEITYNCRPCSQRLHAYRRLHQTPLLLSPHLHPPLRSGRRDLALRGDRHFRGAAARPTSSACWYHRSWSQQRWWFREKTITLLPSPRLLRATFVRREACSVQRRCERSERGSLLAVANACNS